MSHSMSCQPNPDRKGPSIWRTNRHMCRTAAMLPVLGVSQTKVSCSEKTKAAAALVTGNNQSKRTHCFSNGHGRNPQSPARSGVQASSGPTPSNRHYRAVVLKARLPVPLQVSRAKRARGQPHWAPHASAGPLQCYEVPDLFAQEPSK